MCTQLIAKGILPAAKVATEQVLQSVGESVRLKELEVELQRLAIREKELQLANELEMGKLELHLSSGVTDFNELKHLGLNGGI